MEIGFVYIKDNFSKGSMGVYSSNLINALIPLAEKRGDTIRLITNDGSIDYDKKIIVDYNQQSKRIFNLRLAKEIKKKCNCDILHYPDALPLNFKQNTKLVFTYHGIASLDIGPKLTGVNPIKNKLILTFMRYMKYRVDYGIIVSKSELNELLKLNIVPTNKKVIYHGINHDVFKKISSKKVKNKLEKYNLNPNYIFHLSNYSLKKNVFRLVDAFSHASIGTKLVLGGDVPNTIKKYVSKHKIKNIKYTGYIPPEDLPFIYNGAKTFIYPSLHESFGLPILESMACGTPVITSNIYSMPEIGGKAGIYVDPFNKESIKHAIEKIVTDSNYRNKKVKEGIKRASMFTWEKCAKSTYGVYKQLEDIK